LPRPNRDRGSSAAARPPPAAWPRPAPLRSRPDRSSRVDGLDGITREVEPDRPQLVRSAGVCGSELACEREAFFESADVDDVEAEKLLLGFRVRTVDDE